MATLLLVMLLFYVWFLWIIDLSAPGTEGGYEYKGGVREEQVQSMVYVRLDSNSVHNWNRSILQQYYSQIRGCTHKQNLKCLRSLNLELVLKALSKVKSTRDGAPTSIFGWNSLFKLVEYLNVVSWEEICQEYINHLSCCRLIPNTPQCPCFESSD